MIRLARIFQNGMTLQREKPIKIWGSTDCPQQVTVALNGSVLLKDTAIEGELVFTLPPQKAMSDAVLTMTGAHDTVQLSDVDIGEVWIAGGQSNMEFLLRYDAEGPEQIATANDEHFRFYDVGEYSFPEEESYGKKDNAGWNKWLRFRPENAEYFSAVGVYFAKRLRQKLDIPVAVVGCNWGGTTASSWTEESYLAADPDLKEYLGDYAKATKNLDMDQYIRQHDEYLELGADPKVTQALRRTMEGNVSALELIKAIPVLRKIAKHPIPMGPRNHNAPGCLYRMMVKQLAPFSVRGVVWYQGESDNHKPQMYDKLFSAMIRCWRDTWQEELPFLFVQLAPFGRWMGVSGNQYPILRQKQELVSKTVPSCYMASIMDAGMKKDIHPKKKRPVGERLALLALGKVYGEDILCEAPEFLSAELQDGAVLLTFAHAGQGLVFRGKKLNAFRIAVDGKPLKHGKVSVKGNMLRIRSGEIKSNSNVAIRFAWSGYCEANLYNSAGLCAKPFRFG